MSNKFSEISSVHQAVYESFSYVNSGDHETAIKMCFHAASVDPKNPIIYFILGKYLGQQQKHELAFKQFSKAIDLYLEEANICKNLIDAYWLSSLSLYLLGQYRKSLAYMNILLDITPPNNPKYLMQTGLVLFKCSEWQGAVDAFEHVLLIKPSDERAKVMRNEALLKLG